MGYTHYYTFNPTRGKDYSTQFHNALMDIKLALRCLPPRSHTAGGNYQQPITLRGGDGYGEPTFDKKLISFNGDGQTTDDLSHETFFFSFDSSHKQDSFCKTARKPYDFMCCVCLLAFANRIDEMDISSDGDLEDWQPAIDFYEQNIGKLNPERLKKIFEYEEV